VSEMSVGKTVEDFVEEPGQVYVAKTDLKAGALNLVDAVFQNITHIAPAIAGFFFTQFVVSLAGAHAVFAYAIGVAVVLGLGICLAILAKHFPSAGGYFTYISRTVHPRVGFLAGWTFIFYSPMVTGPLCAFFGFIMEAQLKEAYDITFHWWIFPVVAIPVITLLMLRGITLSIRVIVILGILEMLIVLALALSGLADPGPGGFTFEVWNPGFNPGDIATASGLALAVVFSVQGLTGWEAAVPLAEETQNPRRNIPRAIIYSIVILGVLLLVAYWGQIVGWGVDDLTGLTESATLPAFVLGTKYWGDAWPVILVAMFSSVMAVSLACQNVATRMWYGMARQGALPKMVATVDPKRKTPTVAILVQFVMAMGLALGVGFYLGPDVTFFFLVGLTLVLAVIFVYTMANLGVFLYYWRERRSEFNWFFHFLLPFCTAGVLAYSVVKSFQPFPPEPYKYAPAIVGGWMLLGIAVLIYLKVKGKEEWLGKAGDIVEERVETPEELAERRAF
jgi:amino acid transporter